MPEACTEDRERGGRFARRSPHPPPDEPITLDLIEPRDADARPYPTSRPPRPTIRPRLRPRRPPHEPIRHRLRSRRRSSPHHEGPSAVQRLLKFLHTLGAIGFMGSLACLLVLETTAPPPTSLAAYAQARATMAAIANWVFFPSFVLTMVPGFLSIAATRAFHSAGWAWIKAASGIVVYAGGLHVMSPIGEQARLSAEALAGHLDPATLATTPQAHTAAMWMLMALATANVVLGIWRGRLVR